MMLTEALAFLETPLGRLAIAVGGVMLAATLAFSEGYKLRGRLDDADGYRQRAEWLQTQLNAATAASKQEADQAQKDNDALRQRLEDANHAVAQVSNGVCLDGGDADRLRDLWGTPGSHRAN